MMLSRFSLRRTPALAALSTQWRQQLSPRPINLRALPPPVITYSSSSGDHRRPFSGGTPPEKPRMHIVFTCAKCDTRAAKSFTKDAYEKGVVLVTCPGCKARHVIADNLGWFGEDRNIEQILAKQGKSLTRISDEDLEVSP